MAILQLEGKDITYVVSEKSLIIGRSSKADITIHDGKLSRFHCEVGQNEDGYYVKDLNSYNGTTVNGKSISLHVLSPDDKIKLGKTTFHFHLDEKSLKNQGNDVFSSTASLRITSKNLNTTLKLEKEIYTIGRTSANDIKLKDSQISSNHAKIYLKDYCWYIEDLGSKNGVLVNRKKVQVVPLQNRDVIKLGETFFRFAYDQKVRKDTFCHPQILLMVSLSLVIILISILYFLPQRNSQRKLFVEGNIIGDFSFEDSLSWQCKGISFSNNSYKSGKKALFYSSHENAFGEAIYWEDIPLKYGKVYEISIWTKYKKLMGVAGIKIIWFYDDKELGESHSPLVNGNQDKWNQITFLAFPPQKANKIKVKCFIMGEVDEIYFDDILIMEKENQKEPLVNHYSLKGGIDNRGILHLKQVFESFLESGKILIWQNGTTKRLIAKQTIAIGKRKIEKGKISWRGYIYSISQKRKFPIFVLLKKDNEGLSLKVELKIDTEQEKFLVEYVLMNQKCFFKKKIDFGEEEVAVNEFEDIPIALSQMVWKFPQSEKQVGFFYKTPLICRIKENNDRIYFHHILRQNESKKYIFQMNCKTNFSEDISLLKEFEEKAKHFEKQKKFGEAFVLYKKILQNFVFASEVIFAKKRIRQLEKLYKKDEQVFLKELEQAKFFSSDLFYKTLLAKNKQLIPRWKGSEKVLKLEKILREIELEYSKIQELKDEKKIQSLWRRAQNFENENKWLLAKLFYLEIVERFPKSHSAKNAKQKLRKILLKLDRGKNKD